MKVVSNSLKQAYLATKGRLITNFKFPDILKILFFMVIVNLFSFYYFNIENKFEVVIRVFLLLYISVFFKFILYNTLMIKEHNIAIKKNNYLLKSLFLSIVFLIFYAIILYVPKLLILQIDKIGDDSIWKIVSIILFILFLIIFSVVMRLILLNIFMLLLNYDFKNLRKAFSLIRENLISYIKFLFIYFLFFIFLGVIKVVVYKFITVVSSNIFIIFLIQLLKSTIFSIIIFPVAVLEIYFIMFFFYRIDSYPEKSKMSFLLDYLFMRRDG